MNGADIGVRAQHKVCAGGKRHIEFALLATNDKTGLVVGLLGGARMPLNVTLPCPVPMLDPLISVARVTLTLPLLPMILKMPLTPSTVTLPSAA